MHPEMTRRTELNAFQNYPDNNRSFSAPLPEHPYPHHGAFENFHCYDGSSRESVKTDMVTGSMAVNHERNSANTNNSQVYPNPSLVSKTNFQGLFPAQYNPTEANDGYWSQSQSAGNFSHSARSGKESRHSMCATDMRGSNPFVNHRAYSPRSVTSANSSGHDLSVYRDHAVSTTTLTRSNSSLWSVPSHDSVHSSDEGYSTSRTLSACNSRERLVNHPYQDTLCGMGDANVNRMYNQHQEQCGLSPLNSISPMTKNNRRSNLQVDTTFGVSNLRSEQQEQSLAATQLTKSRMMLSDQDCYPNDFQHQPSLRQQHPTQQYQYEHPQTSQKVRMSQRMSQQNQQQQSLQNLQNSHRERAESQQDYRAPRNAAIVPNQYPTLDHMNTPYDGQVYDDHQDSRYNHKQQSQMHQNVANMNMNQNNSMLMLFGASASYEQQSRYSNSKSMKSQYGNGNGGSYGMYNQVDHDINHFQFNSMHDVMQNAPFISTAV